MDSLRQYLITVTSAAVVSAVVNSFAGKNGTHSAVIKMLTGLFVSLAVISPILKLEINEFGDFSNSFLEEAQSTASIGEAAALSSVREIITDKTSAYILDKANSMGLDINVEVILDDENPPKPCFVIISGSVSPYAKEILGEYIADNLAIPKEDQQWS